MSIASLKKKLQDKHGDNTIMWASEIPPYEVFSSGSLALDYATGVGGFPTNRVIEIVGREATGKSTLALHAMHNRLLFERAKGSKRGAMYIDIENRMSEDWLRNFVGPEFLEHVIIVRPDAMEEATNYYVEACRSGDIAIVILDSIGAAPTKAVLEKDATVGAMGGNSQAVTRFAQFSMSMSGKNDITTIGINQVRDDLSGFHQLNSPGGRAWKHACSLRIELKPGKDKVEEEIQGEKMQVGYNVTARVRKNSLGPPHRQATYWFYNVENSRGFGVDQTEEVIRLGLLTGAIERVNASTYEHPAIGRVRGRDAVVTALREQPEAVVAIRESVLQVMRSGHVQGIVEAFDPDTVDAQDAAEEAASKSPVRALKVVDKDTQDD